MLNKQYGYYIWATVEGFGAYLDRCKLLLRSICVQFNKIIKIEKQMSHMEFLEEMFNQARPKARYMSQMHIEDETDSIEKELINGDIEISREKLTVDKNSPKNDYETYMKQKYLQQIQKQKNKLQHKLNYISNSITSINKVDFLKSRSRGDINSERLSNSSYNIRQKQAEWRKQIKERSKRNETKKQQLQQIDKRRIKEMQEIKDRIKMQETEKRHKQFEKKIQDIHNRTKKREQAIKDENQKIQQIINKKQMYQELTERYNRKEEGILELRKKKLAEIRSFYKPIDSQQIKDHQQKILEIKRQKQEMREREKKMNESRSKSYKPFYQSVFYKRIVESNAEQENQVKQRLERMKQFSQDVKNKYVPEIDENKRRYFQQKQQKFEKQKRSKQQRSLQLLKMPMTKGLGYLQQIKKLPKKRKDPNSVIDRQMKTEKTVYKNYINRSTEVATSNKPWKTILKQDCNKVDKAILLQFESERVQQTLKRKQVESKLLKKIDNGQIDQGYYEMIKAKLDLLQSNK